MLTMDKILGINYKIFSKKTPQGTPGEFFYVVTFLVKYFNQLIL